MEIKNFTQFAGILSSNRMIHLHPSFDRLYTCMMLYNSMCNCGGNSNTEKTNKHNECNRIYKEAIGTTDSFKAYFFLNCSENTITFYVDDAHRIKTLCR